MLKAQLDKFVMSLITHARNLSEVKSKYDETVDEFLASLEETANPTAKGVKKSGAKKTR